MPRLRNGAAEIGTNTSGSMAAVDAAVLHARHDADDLDHPAGLLPGRYRPGASNVTRPANRIDPRQEPLDEPLVDDGDLRARVQIVRGEVPSLQQRDAERLEVAVAADARVARASDPACAMPVHVEIRPHAAERREADRGRRVDDPRATLRMRSSACVTNRV